MRTSKHPDVRKEKPRYKLRTIMSSPAEYFKESNLHYPKLKDLLTEDEYDSARSTVLYSFYTSPVVIDSIYTVLQNAGFEGGNILEPSMGVGNFFTVRTVV